MKKILCVDDEVSILKFLRHILVGVGYDVLSTSDSRDTFSIIEEENPDLVILDVLMPGITGLEIFDELKRRFSQCPVLFATGYPNSFDLGTEKNRERYEKGFADGQTDILYKPFGPGDVLEKVESLIGPSKRTT